MRTARLYTDAASGTLRERHIRLTVVKGPDAGMSATLGPGTTVVGTHPSCDVRLADSTISRFHVELALRPDGVKVTDLESTNGTAHGEARLGQVLLVGPARLRLGKSTEVEIAPSDDVVELSLYPADRFGAVLGAAPPMRSLFALCAHVATREATVLLEGEPGTGKQALARAIHEHSPRASAAFVTAACAGLAPAELGTLAQAASGGTLYLAEVGELPADAQAQLEAVFAARDTRVVASTRRDLRRLVKAGGFRDELHQRLDEVRATVPPLRLRRDDVRLLVAAFTAELGRPGFVASDELLRALGAHDWPGNVRELRQLIERAVAVPGGPSAGALAERLEHEYNAYRNANRD